GVLFGGFAAKNPDPTTIAVTPDTAAVAEALQNTTITEVADADAAEELVRSGEVSVALVPSGDPAFGYSAVFLDGVSNSLLMQLAKVPPVEILEPATTDAMLRYFIAIGFGVVFLIAASTFGGTIAQSVVEE